MSFRRLAEMTWREVRDVAPRSVAILPVGAIEAHGPHLPLSTDVIIAEEMARRAAERLAADGTEVLLLPACALTPADFAAGFAGTLSLGEETAAAILVDIAASLAAHGVRRLVVANSHVDPGNVRSLKAAAEEVRSRGLLQVIHPDKCEKPWVLRLPEEFRRGGAHAGYYETSLVLAARPELVRRDIRARLPKVDVDLGAKIRAGARTFGDCGGPEAYFGNPASASAEDGDRFFDILADMLVEAAKA